MNGARAVPDNTIATPKTIITSRIGANHHFFVRHSKYQNSLKSPMSRCSEAAFSNSLTLLSLIVTFHGLGLTQIATDVGGASLGLPVTRPLWRIAASKGVAANQLEDKSYGGEESEE